MISDDIIWALLKSDKHSKAVLQKKVEDAIKAIDTQKITKALEEDLLAFIEHGDIEWDDIVQTKIFGKIITDGLREHFNIPQNKRR